MIVEQNGQTTLFGDSPEYEAFVDKFEVKKTTDDCYTPENVYNAVADWVAQEYGLDRVAFVRPFWPGGDFERFAYPEGCVVVDNPPFSIRAQIVDFYTRRGIRFFIFSPALSLLVRGRRVCHIAVGVTVTYANGAEVPTSFVTNLEDAALRTAPALYRAVKKANDDNLAQGKKHVPKYEYPDYVVTAAIAQRWCRYGVDYRVGYEDAVFVSALDDQAATGKEIFGGGLLLSDRAAAERAEAERAAVDRAAAQRGELSARERAIVAKLGGGE